MRLHVTHDDKFLDYFIANAESAGYEDNYYLIYNDAEELKYTKSDKVKVARLYSKEFYRTIGDICKYDVVYVHYFTSALSDFVLSIPRSIPLVWVFWGGDGFEHPAIRQRILKPLTLKYYNQTSVSKYREKGWGNPFKKLLDNTERKWKRAVGRFDYFCHYIEEDWILLRNEFDLKASLIDFNYGGWYQLTDICTSLRCSSGGNICLGNSGDISNNHLDAIEMLIGKLSAGQKIYAPLSYAAPSREYVDVVSCKGHEFFGADFIPLTAFLQKHEYDEILESCHYVIMPHIRSQAFGNIQFALARGKKIYMSCESSLYRLLKGQGFKIFNIEDDLLQREALWAPICREDIECNQVLLDKHYGCNKMMERYRASMEPGSRNKH